jgi:hypothetical protein
MLFSDARANVAALGTMLLAGSLMIAHGTRFSDFTPLAASEAMRERAIGALLSEKTLAAAARRCGLNEKTLRRWLAEDAGFKQAFAHPNDPVAARPCPGPAHGHLPAPVPASSTSGRQPVGRARHPGAGHRAPVAAAPQAVTRPPSEVADIVRQHGNRFLDAHRAWVTGRHRRVFRAIAQ